MSGFTESNSVVSTCTGDRVGKRNHSYCLCLYVFSKWLDKCALVGLPLCFQQVCNKTVLGPHSFGGEGLASLACEGPHCVGTMATMAQPVTTKEVKEGLFKCKLNAIHVFETLVPMSAIQPSLQAEEQQFTPTPSSKGGDLSLKHRLLIAMDEACNPCPFIVKSYSVPIGHLIFHGAINRSLQRRT